MRLPHFQAKNGHPQQDRSLVDPQKESSKDEADRAARAPPHPSYLRLAREEAIASRQDAPAFHLHSSPRAQDDRALVVPQTSMHRSLQEHQHRALARFESRS